MKKLSLKEVKDRAKDKNISIMSKEYENTRSRIKCKCNKCNHEWLVLAANILKPSGYGCPECGKVKAKNTIKHNLDMSHFWNKVDSDFIKQYKVEGKYTGQHGKLKCTCNKCRYTWQTSPYKLYKKQGCIKCGHKSKGQKLRKSSKQFQSEVNKIHENTIIIISNYVSGKHPIKFKCTLCNKTQTKPQAYRLLKRGCTFCNYSKGEYKIETILKNNNIRFKKQYKFKKLGNLRFDFAILNDDDSLFYLIEYDGIQHFESFSWFGGENRLKKQQKSDSLKNIFCKNNNIPLIRIPYTKYDNLTLEDLLWKQSR